MAKRIKQYRYFGEGDTLHNTPDNKPENAYIAINIGSALNMIPIVTPIVTPNVAPTNIPFFQPITIIIKIHKTLQIDISYIVKSPNTEIASDNKRR